MAVHFIDTTSQQACATSNFARLAGCMKTLKWLRVCVCMRLCVRKWLPGGCSAPKTCSRLGVSFYFRISILQIFTVISMPALFVHIVLGIFCCLLLLILFVITVLLPALVVLVMSKSSELSIK